jgi:hypothetical protein
MVQTYQTINVVMKDLKLLKVKKLAKVHPKQSGMEKSC